MRIVVFTALITIVTVTSANAQLKLPNIGGDVGNFLEQRKKDLQNGGVIPKDPVGMVRDMAGAIASGDLGRMQQAIGNVALNSGGCVGCEQFAKTVLPTLSADQIHQVAGQGALTFLGTGDPVLVVIDIAANTVQQLSFSNTQTVEPPISASPPAMPPSPPQTYSTVATCMLVRNGIVWAGWADEPVLTASSGEKGSFLKLAADDTVNVTAPFCKGWSDLQTGALAVTKASFNYAPPPRIITSPRSDLVKVILSGSGSGSGS